MFTAGGTVIVTGAGRGLGRATALIAAREGLAVAVWDRAGGIVQGFDRAGARLGDTGRGQRRAGLGLVEDRPPGQVLPLSGRLGNVEKVDTESRADGTQQVLAVYLGTSGDHQQQRGLRRAAARGHWAGAAVCRAASILSTTA